MTGQVSAFKKAGVKAILFSAAPPQAASLAGVAASQKLDVPIVANGPGWTPQLLKTPAAEALDANYYVVSSMAPLSVQSEGVQKFLTDYKAANPKGTPSSNGSLYAYAGAQIADAALTKACENKDLTRKGVLDALRSLNALDTGGTVAGTLDFTDPSRPPGKLVYIAKVSAGRARRPGGAGRAVRGRRRPGVRVQVTTAQRFAVTLAELPGLAGQRLGPTEWREMTQDRVDAFADVTEDHNYIHVDVEAAKASPFGGTIAHGYLSVSLLAPISMDLLQVTDAATSVNYGMDKLRFPAPLPVGARFRGAGEIMEVTEVKGGMQVKVAFTLEVADQAKPALVAECLYRYYG